MAEAITTKGKDIVLALTASEARGLLLLANRGVDAAPTAAEQRALIGNPKAVECALDALRALGGAVAPGLRPQTWGSIKR